MERFDVAVVGGGPAGCRAAWRLARAGARVAILDGSHPREKPCGGGVTGRAREFVGEAVDTAAIAAVPVETATFEHGAARARVDLDRDGLTTPHLTVASRTRFDGALLAAAVAAGAAHRPERVVDLVADGHGWCLSTRTGRTRASWVLGADGPNSFVRRRVSVPFERADLSIATGFFVHRASTREITIAFEDEPPGYLWSFPRPDHLAVGVCAQADASGPNRLRALASRWIARALPAADVRLEPYSWPIPSLRETTLTKEQPAGSRWMLLGDAAGLVDPITREGIFFALVSGDAAAECLIEANDPAARYTGQLRSLAYDELIRAARLKAQFFTPRFTALLLRALHESAAIGTIMTDLIGGRQPYRGLRRRLLGTMHLGLLARLLLR